MRKLLFIFLLILVFSFGYILNNTYAAEKMTKGWDRPYWVSSLVETPVKNTQGEYLGRIDDFIIDNGGISFAILVYGGFLRIGEKSVAIPFNALSLGDKGRYFVLDISRERLESAPTFSMITDLANRKWAEDVYKYFGQQPYWTEGEHSGRLSPTNKEPMKPQTYLQKAFPYGYYPLALLPYGSFYLGPTETPCK